MFSLNKEYLSLVYRAWRYRLKLDRAEIKYIRENIPAGSLAIDIGAHKGAYSYWMLKTVGKDGMVLCFEPQPVLANKLQQILTKVCGQNVRIENLGVGDKQGVLQLNIPGNKPSPGASFVENKFNSADTTQVDVSVITLDSYLADHPMDRKLSFIKCDVEGFELEVFKGAENALRKHKPVLLFECEQRHLPNRQITDVFQFLEQMGYAGKFFLQGELVPVSEFSVEQHQVQGSDNYCNNFVFT